MNDPTITQYAKPITMQNREDIGDVNFANYGPHGYVVAIDTKLIGSYKGKKYHELPPEIGRIAAFEAQTGTQAGTNTETEIQFAPCRDMIPESTLARSGKGFNQGITDGTIQCVNPEDVSVNIYSDGLGQGKQFFKFKFVACSSEAQHGVTCYTDAELKDFLKHVFVKFLSYQTKTKVAFEEKDNYFFPIIKKAGMDRLKHGEQFLRKSTLRIFETTMNDNIYNPFDQMSDQDQSLYIYS